MVISLTLATTLKVLIPSVLSFFVGIFLTPALSSFLYEHKCWKKKVRNVTTDGKPAPITSKIYEDKDVGTPRMGGVIIWLATLVTAAILVIVSAVFPDRATLGILDFVDRGETWLPLFTLFVGAMVGLTDDYFEVSERRDYFAGGLSLKKRILAVCAIGLAGAWWFYSKLEFTSLYVPFIGPWEIGIVMVPFFVFMMLLMYGGSVIDGVDGLSGGVFSSIFSAYGIIAFAQGQFHLAAFCFAIVGGLLAFLWFNIPPARFYMSETGSMALTITLSVVAFLTHNALTLFIVALPLIATEASSALQLLSKQLWGRKLFLVAPLHHYFEAVGWSREKITMRYWIISLICALLGVIIALLG